MSTVLLDVDGTLVDSTYLHVLTWCQAFAEAGHPVPGSRVQRQIGKGSPQLLAALLGDELAERIGEDVTQRRSELYLGQTDQLRPLPGAVEFVTTLVRRDLSVVLATSASPAERDVLLQVLDLPVDVAAITDSDDVGTAKPAPDLVAVAMQKVDAETATTVMVGDAVWDVESGAKAGIPVVGVLSGGLARSELSDAGAVAVYDDAAALLADLDGSLLARLLR